MTQSLKLQRDVVALEAFSITTPTQLVKSILPNMSNGFKKFLAKISFSQKNVSLDVDTKSFLKQLHDINFLDISEVHIQPPEGFKSGKLYKDYSKDLLIASEKFSKIEDELLTPFSTYIANLISSTEHKFDTSNYFLHLDTYGKESEGIFNTLSTYFDNSHSDKRLGEVLERHADWTDILSNLTTTNSLLNKVNLVNLNKKINEIAAYLEVLTKKTEKGELDNLSKEVIKSISEGTYQVANELQRFSSIQYQVMALNASVEDIAKRIYKV